MWGLAEDIGSGMRACLASSAGHPAGGPRLSSHIGKTLFSVSSCLLRCPSDQTRVACEQRSLWQGLCASVVDFFRGTILFWACPSNGSWALGHGRSARNSGPHCEPTLQTFLTSGLDQAPSNSSEEL